MSESDGHGNPLKTEGLTDAEALEMLTQAVSEHKLLAEAVLEQNKQMLQRDKRMSDQNGVLAQLLEKLLRQNQKAPASAEAQAETGPPSEHKCRFCKRTSQKVKFRKHKKNGNYRLDCLCCEYGIERVQKYLLSEGQKVFDLYSGTGAFDEMVIRVSEMRRKSPEQKVEPDWTALRQSVAKVLDSGAPSRRRVSKKKQKQGKKKGERQVLDDNQHALVYQVALEELKGRASAKDPEDRKFANRDLRRHREVRKILGGRRELTSYNARVCFEKAKEQNLIRQVGHKRNAAYVYVGPLDD